jgi:cystathionine beta-synthase
VVVEATSGNTGIGLAIAAAIKGYQCIFTIPDKMSSEKIRLLRAFGAEVVVVPTAVPPDHPEYYIQKALSIVEATPGAIFANQHYNPDNPEAHYRTTGPEIWEQTEGRITHFVCAPGTGGTITGVGRYLKEQNPEVQIIAGDPVGSIYAEYGRTREKGEGGPYKVEGIGGDKIPTSLDFDVVDEWMMATDADAFRTARRLTREEGVFIGGSGGLNVWCALEVARRLDDPEALVVTILCDTGERYLSKLYDDTWMHDNQMLDAERTTAGQLLERHPEGVPPIVSVGPAASLRQALNLLSTWGVSQLPVLDGQDCVGSVGEGLMARVLEDSGLLDRPAAEVMAGPFPVVDADVPLDRLVTLLSKETPAALVREGGRLIGIVNRYDVLREVAGIG